MSLEEDEDAYACDENEAGKDDDQDDESRS